MTTQHIEKQRDTTVQFRSGQLALDAVCAMAEFDLVGKVISANPQFATLMGFLDQDALVGLHHDAFVFNHRQPMCFWQDVINGNITNGEFIRRTRQQQTVWIQAVYAPVLNVQDHTLQGILLIAMDVTQQKNIYAEYHSRLEALDRSQGVIEFDRNGFIVKANDNYLAMAGYAEHELIGRHHAWLCDKNYLTTDDYRQFWQDLRRGAFRNGRFQRVGKHGRPFWIQANYSPVFDSEGNLSRVVKYAHDITAQVAAEQKAARQSAILDILLEAQTGFLHDHNLASACDSVFARLLDVTHSEFGFIGIVQSVAGKANLYIPSISNLAWDKETRQCYNEQRQTHGGLMLDRLDNMFGQVVTQNTVVHLNNFPSPGNAHNLPAGFPPLFNYLGIPVVFDGKPIGMIALANCPEGMDQNMVELLEPLVTTLGTLIHARALEDKRSEIEAMLRFNASHDGLTRLPNRGHFFDALRELFLCTDTHRDLSGHCLALVDVDFFKKINDSYGHLAGDVLLQALARILETHVRASDLVARMGGEEFIILLRNLTRQDAMAVMERLRDAVESHRFSWEGRTVSFTVSIGVAPWSAQCRSIDDWVQVADDNLYAAKEQGRNRVY